MKQYSIAYLDDVVENQGELFELIADNYPNKDTNKFIIYYMNSKMRKDIDESQSYLNTMFASELWDYFQKNEHYKLENGDSLKGFLPKWIGEFYAYYQWYYSIPSSEVIQKVPLSFLEKAYYGLHDLDLDLAVKKVGIE